MDNPRDPTLIECFSELNDPRQERGNKRHLLIDILMIGLCGVLCGAETWVDIELFAKSKETWFQKFLKLPSGIPSHDTIARVFSRLDPEEFQAGFLKWVSGVASKIGGDVVAIDGKTVRGSYDRGGDKVAIHMVSAWARENGIVLGQQKVDEKSNEITAIPELLKRLDIAGCIVTIDAMGCQTSIAEKIVDQGANYVLALKGNHGDLHDDVKYFLEECISCQWQGIVHQHVQTVDGDHGRVETRDYYLCTEIDWLDSKEKWKGLAAIGMVRSVRDMGEKTTTETRYYLTTLKEVEGFANATRGHWSVENSLHWVLDVAFREDESRVRKDHAAENFSTLRRIVLNLLKQDQAFKRGIKGKRLRAGWDDKYRSRILKQV